MMTDDIREDEEELPPGPFVKIYGSIVYSSIWLEGAGTRLLWITMLAIADQDGNVRGSVRGLAATAKITPEECEAGLKILESPDPDSQDKQFDGRRIRRMGNGWHILNFRRYREMRTPQQIKTADRVRKHRERKQLHDVTGVTVTPEVEVEVESLLSSVPKPQPSDSHISTWNVPGSGTLELTRMLNRGMGDNPAIGEVYNPVLATTGHTLEACDQLRDHGVDLGFAESWVYTFAAAYKPKKPGDQIRSLTYLVPAIQDAWDRVNARIDASKAERPPEPRSDPEPTTRTSPRASNNGTRDQKGRGVLIFGELQRAVREVNVLNNPDDPGAGNRLERRIPDEIIATLDEYARRALESIGGQRAIAYAPADRTESMAWRFAAAYQAAANE